MTTIKTQESLKCLLDTEADKDGFQLTRLCGLRLAAAGPAPVQGPAILKTAAGLCQGADFVCAGSKRSADRFAVTFRVVGTVLEWRAIWRADKATDPINERNAMTRPDRNLFAPIAVQGSAVPSERVKRVIMACLK